MQGFAEARTSPHLAGLRSRQEKRKSVAKCQRADDAAMAMIGHKTEKAATSSGVHVRLCCIMLRTAQDGQK
jgi:hypothetical protein